MAARRNKPIDLVLAGGGVKGIGLVGAVVKLMDAGYRPNRIAGTSAGSMVGAIVAAATPDGKTTGDQIKDLVMGIDYLKFLDSGLIKGVPLLGGTWGMLEGSGIFRGDYAHDFIAGELKTMGVETFGDLRLDDDDLPPERRYRLVVTATDVTRGLLVRLPFSDTPQNIGGPFPSCPSMATSSAKPRRPAIFGKTLPSINGLRSNHTADLTRCCRTGPPATPAARQAAHRRGPRHRRERRSPRRAAGRPAAGLPARG